MTLKNQPGCILVSCEVDFCHFILSTSLPHLSLDKSHIHLGTPGSPRLHSPNQSDTLRTSPHTRWTSLLTPCATLSSCRFAALIAHPLVFKAHFQVCTFHLHISISHLSHHSPLLTLHIHISHLENHLAFHSRISAQRVLFLC